MEQYLGTLGKDYIIIRKIGSGGTAKVFLVKKYNSEINYVAKVLKGPKPKDEENEDENEDENEEEEEEALDSIEVFNNEIKVLTFLKDKNINSFIINMIENGEGEVKRENRPNSFNKYIILEYAKKGCLFDYVFHPKKGFSEEYSKIIFYKILKAFQALQKLEVCHRDIKLENILLDEKYNPKIGDFGFSDLKIKELTGNLGTYSYAAPEIFSSNPYDGIKIDIFSLGTTLFSLVTSKKGFIIASEKCPLYKFIINNKFDKYWEMLESNNIIPTDLTDDFKKLYFNMVSFNPEKRPTIDQILKDNWMKDVNEEYIKKFEDEMEKEFKNREQKIKDALEDNINTKNNDSSFLGSTRSGGKEVYPYFEKDLKPKMIDNEIGIKNYIKIIGDLESVYFMNLLLTEINEKYDNKCEIIENKNVLKFNLDFKEENDNNFPKELAEILNKLKKRKKNCLIEVKLYKLKNGEHLLRFEKLFGELENYYKKVEEIKDLIKKLL